MKRHLFILIPTTITIFLVFLLSSVIATHKPGSCVGYCGQYAVKSNCYCDVASFNPANNDHCQDIATACSTIYAQGIAQYGTPYPQPYPQSYPTATTTPTPISKPSEIVCTKDKCDKSFSTTEGTCWCDSACKGIGDCCNKDFDYQSVCKGITTSTTPAPTPTPYPYPKPTPVTGLTFPTAGYTVAYNITSSNPAGYNNFNIYATLASNDAWAKIVIQDNTGATVDTLVINEKDTKSSFNTGLQIHVIDVSALPDGTVKGVDLVVGIAVCKA